MQSDELYIKRCLELAQRGKGAVAPNPMVGAVLVHDGRVIGEGWHRQFGGPHAEVNCLADVKEEDRALIADSTMYVSLEPCAHFGKTPPCAKRLAEERVKKVVLCNIDPFPKVQGGGVKILSEAGIPSEQGVMAVEGAWVNRRFFCFHEQKRPYIILKWAESPNGFFAPEDRSRFQMTGKASKQLVHKWRAEESSIMVGYNTALNDDPELTARMWDGPQPLRIVVDRKLQLPETLKVFDGNVATWVLNERESKVSEDGVSYIQLDFGKDIIPQLLQKLYDANIISLFVEGGSTLLQSFINAGLWDEARVFTAENVSIERGISVPQLNNGEEQFSTEVGGDTFKFYLNKDNPYKYPQGWEL